MNTDKMLRRAAHCDRQANNPALSPVVRERFRVEADRMRAMTRPAVNCSVCGDYDAATVLDGRHVCHHCATDALCLACGEVEFGRPAEMDRHDNVHITCACGHSWRSPDSGVAVHNRDLGGDENIFGD